MTDGIKSVLMLRNEIVAILDKDITWDSKRNQSIRMNDVILPHYWYHTIFFKISELLPIKQCLCSVGDINFSIKVTKYGEVFRDVVVSILDKDLSPITTYAQLKQGVEYRADGMTYVAMKIVKSAA